MAKKSSQIVDLFEALKASFDANPMTDIPTSTGYPEQFAAGMQALLGDPALKVGNEYTLGRLPEGTLFRFVRDATLGTWRVGKPDRPEFSDPRCYRVGAESSNKPFSSSCKVIVVELPPAPSGLDGFTEPGGINRISIGYVAPVAVDPFDSADFYDCGQSPEGLTHTTPAEAMAVLFSECQLTHDAIDSVICERNPLTVAAYRHIAIPEEWFVLVSQRVADLAAEDFSDSELLGGPDSLLVSREQIVAGAKLLEPALRAMFRDVKPWHCERVATREYSAEQVDAILRERKPEWFKP